MKSSAHEMSANNKSPKEGFSKRTRIAMVFAVVAVGILFVLQAGVFGDTKIGVTLKTNSDLENGLVGHWTFDGNNIDFSQTSAEVRDSSGQGNHGDLRGVPSGTITETTSTSTAGEGDPPSITHDLTINAGDVIVALVNINAINNTISDDNGAFAFTEVFQENVGGAGDDRYAIYSRTAGASEPSSYSWSETTPERWSLTLRVFSGVHADIWDVTPSASTRDLGTGTAVTAPTMTTVTDGALGLMAAFADNRTRTFSGQTNGYGTEVEPPSGASQASYIREWATVGDTGSVGVTMSSTGADWAAHQVALRPASELPTSVGKVGQALSFDAVNDYVNFGNIGSGLETIAFWAKIATSTANQVYVDIDGTDKIETNGSSIVTATSFPAATVYVDGVQNGSFVADTLWHHIVVTDTTGVAGTTFTTGTTTTHYGGALDDVRVYNRVLSSEEAKRLYELGATTKIATTITSNSDLESGLVGHWTFDGPDLFQNATDRSGQGNTGYLTGITATTTAPGRIGQAITFDSSNDEYIDIANSPELQFDESDFTISMWIYSEGTVDSNHEDLYTQGAGGTGTGEFAFYINVDDTMRFIREGAVTLSSGEVIADGTWHFITAVREGDRLTLYDDAVSEGTNATYFSGISLNDTAGSAIARGHGGLRFFNGSIDDVRAYNRALSQSEITRLYELGATTKIATTITSNSDLESGLVGHWTFDGPDLFQNATDRSGQGNTGYLTGFAATTTTPGRIGQAIEFDGSDDFVRIDDSSSLSPTDAVSVVAWVRLTGLDDALVAHYDTGANQRAWDMLIHTDAQLRVVVSDNGTGNTLNAKDYRTIDSDLSGGAWHYVGFTFSGSGSALNLYHNGQLETNITKTADPSITSIHDSTADITIGSQLNSGSVSRPADGVIDDVRIYNRELSASEIERLYNLGK